MRSDKILFLLQPIYNSFKVFNFKIIHNGRLQDGFN